MGMYDYLYYEGDEYQTRDTPSQWMRKYKIEDGKLYEDVINDQDPYSYCIPKTQYEFCSSFDGVINFYRNISEERGKYVWLEYKALIMDGNVIKFNEVKK